jgi:peptide/nickel transport system substrate-binding protein
MAKWQFLGGKFVTHLRRFCALLTVIVPLAITAIIQTAAAESIIRVGVSARDLGSLDPATGIGNGDEFAMRQIHSVLFGPKNGTSNLTFDQLQGELAETWEMAPDARSFTFHLRHGVQWQRGYGEVTADDVAFTVARMQDPKTGTAYGANFRDVEGVDVADRYTVTIRLNKPNPFWYAFAIMPRFGGYIMSRKAVTELGDDFRRNPVGAGPFEFVSYDPKQKSVLRANPAYWDGKPKIDRLEVLYLPETSSRTLAFVKGDVDLIEGAVVPGWLASVKRQKPDLVQDLGRPGAVWAFYLNMTRKPFDDIRVRQAIAHAIDVRAWSAAFGDFVTPMYGVSPVGYYGALEKEDLPPDWPFTYDPVRSKALLAEAGFSNGFAVDVFISEREEYKTNLLIIQEQLRKVGIQINLRLVDHVSYHNDIRRDLDAMVMYSSGQPPLTQAVLNAFYNSAAIVGKPTRNMNYSHYGDLAGNSDALMAQANAEIDDGKRLALLKQVQIEILRQIPSIPLPSPGSLWMHNGQTLDIGFSIKAYMGTFTLSKASRL